MNLEQHRFDGRIRYRYPTPIAAPYRMSRIAHRPDIRLAHLLGTIDETLRFICFVMTADYLAATREAPDPKVEGLLMNLQQPNTKSILELVTRLASIPTPRTPFVPEFRAALRSTLADEIEQLVADASAVRIERNLLGAEDCDAWNRMLGPRVDRLLAGLNFLEQLLLVRCEHVGKNDSLPADLHVDNRAQTWHLQGWRGVGNARPMLVRAAQDAFPPERTVLLMRPDQPDALRLDPFLVPGGDGRLLTLTYAPEMVEIVYGHYPSGQQVIWDVPLGRVLAERGLRNGRIPLSLSEASAARLRHHVTAPPPELPGYAEAIRTTVDEQGEHFRAVDVESGAVHSVVRIHPHRIRDEVHLHELVESTDRLRRIEHPNIATPDTIRFDATHETLVTGTVHPPFGRLIDRMPAGAPVPVHSAVAVAETVLLAIEALDEQGIRLASVPPWAISLGASTKKETDIGSRVHVAPLLAGTGGRLSDASRMVAELLYQMLTGTILDDLELEPHIVRAKVPVELSNAVMAGLRGAFDTPRAFRLALRATGVKTPPDANNNFGHQAATRAFGHLQRLRPGALQTLEEALSAAEAENDLKALRACAQRLIDAHWDPNQRLLVLARVLEHEDMVLPKPALALVQQIVDLAGDHLPTLLYVAREAGELIRSPDLVRIRRRILEATQDIDELAESTAVLAHLCESRKELEDADGFWARLTELAPERIEGWLGRARVARILGDPHERAKRLEDTLERLEAGELKHELMTELARLRATQLRDVKGALTLYNEVTSAQAVGVDIWLSLRDLARESFDDASLSKALKGILTSAQATAVQKREAQIELITYFGFQRNELQRIAKVLKDLFEKWPNDRATLSIYAEYLERTEQWAKASEVLERWASEESEPWCFGLLLKRLANINATHLANPERAAEFYQGVLETTPDDQEALAYLEQHYETNEQWDMLEPIWMSQIDRAPTPHARTDALERIAKLQDNILGDTESAYRSYETILTEDPTRVDHLDRFVALAIELEDQKNARRVIDQVVPHLPPTVSGEWRRRGLGPDTSDLFGSVEFFRERIRQSPNDPSGWKGLAKACERIGAWSEQVDALHQVVELVSEEPERTVELLISIANIQRDRMLKPREAVNTYNRILILDPENAAATEGLCTVAEAAGLTAQQRSEALKRAIDLCTDPDKRIELLETLMAIAVPAGLSHESVIAALQALLELDPANSDALEELENRCRHNDDLAGVIRAIEKRISAAPESQRTELVQHLIRTQLTEAGDAEGASQTLIAWLEERPISEIPTELAEITLSRAGKYTELTDILRKRAEQTQSPEHRAELRYREAVIHADHLLDTSKAHSLMEQAIKDDPRHIGALGFLGEAHVAAQRWLEANTVLEALVRIVESTEQNSNQTLKREALSSLALTREKLGHDDLAGEAWKQVLDIAPDYLHALAGIARIAWNERNYDKAESHYKRLLEIHEHALQPAQLAEIQGALGEIALAHGDDKTSREFLEQALTGTEDPRELLVELVELCERQQDWAGALKHRTSLLDHVDEPLERFSLLIDTAIVAKRANASEAQFQLLSGALDLRSESMVAAVPFLEVAMELGRYQEAARILDMLSTREADATKKAKYVHTLGLLYRDQLHDDVQALSSLNLALDLDPTRLTAFEDLDRILVDRKDWPGQAESYEAMLSRITDSDGNNLSYRLLNSLARIYETQLNAPEKALDAYTRAIAIQSDNVELRRKAARLVETVDPASADALNHYRSIVLTNIDDIDAWQAIGRIFARQHRRDAVWCACGVLQLRSELDENASIFYDAHQHSSLSLSKALTGTNDWESYFYRPTHDLLLSRLFEWLARVTGSHIASKSLQDLGLSPRDRVSLREKSRFTAFLGTVSKILNVPIPGVYRSAALRGICKEPTNPPAMILGPEVLTGRKGKELRFQLGKAMSYFTLPHLLAGMYPVGHLRTMVAAALRLARPEMAQNAGSGVRGIQKKLSELMRPDDQAALTALANEVIERGVNPDVSQWLQDVEIAANRAGHLLSNDLEVSMRLLRTAHQQGTGWSDLSLQDALDDLQRYQVSEQYLALRQQVGAAIPESS